MSAKQQNFAPEDYSRFLIREFLKKSGFDKTYDQFMLEDTRPRVTMTKNELTRLLGMEAVVKRNAKTKTFNTMLDLISNYLSVTKDVLGGIDLPESSAKTAQNPSMSSQVQVTQTTAASTTSIHQPSQLYAAKQQSDQSRKPLACAKTTTNWFNDSKKKESTYQSSQASSTAIGYKPYGANASGIGSLVKDQNPSLQVLNEGRTGASRHTEEDDDDWDAEEVTVQKKGVGRQGGGNSQSFYGANAQKPHTDTMGKPVSTTGLSGTQQKKPNSFLMGSNPSQTTYLNQGNPTVKQGGFFNSNSENSLEEEFDREPASKQLAQVKRKPFFDQAGEDDLDDLDDLMDGMKVGGGKPAKVKRDEDDFFGGSKPKPKPKKVTNVDDGGRDTLSFLRRAEEEQEAKTQKLRMEAEEAKESYKQLCELKIDLSGFSLQGPDKVSQSNAFGGSSQSSDGISLKEQQGIKKLLFRSEQGNFHDSWCQGFYFDDKMKYGIYQNQGGPCGILATVEAFFLKHLLFVHKVMITDVTKQMQETLIASAITDILINAASETPTAKVVLALPQGSQRYSSGMGKAKPIQPTACSMTSYAQGPDQRQKVYNGVRASLKTFTDRSGPGVVLLVYSVILTRGIEKIREDMDMPDCSLVNEHGYASQELLNIMLVGKAASNVHDGNKDLGGGFILKGIQKQSDVGFLTLFEHYEAMVVGSNLKKPRVPIWIICSESHYSIMFSTDFSILTKASSQRKFDLVYYDELARQEDDIILTVEPGKQVAKASGMKKAGDMVIPLEAVIRTKWPKSLVRWNGRTQIL